ncbi:hypothetical protein L1987_80650 [Smallanthus sonchifolius]|uniref:Uncharacterized protein n=1 Tax=Smallanthus sonchifolius TaxID=185202 RepID=A0ACB8YN99_9ASTR|nr:hypothetical protein L1987_80650 [Smallanthus sonchifolius]
MDRRGKHEYLVICGKKDLRNLSCVSFFYTYTPIYFSLSSLISLAVGYQQALEQSIFKGCYCLVWFRR